MKRLYLFALVLCFPVLVWGGSSKIGIKGGLYISSLGADLVTEIENASLTALHDRYTGFHLGLVGSFVFPGFFLQPELLWVGTGRDMQILYPGAPESDDYYIQKFQHLSLPVMLGIKIGPLKFGAGPVVNATISQSNNAISTNSIRHDLRQATIGYQIGGGLQIGSLLLEVRRESSLTNYAEGIQIGDQFYAFDMRPTQLIISIGLLF